MARLRNARTRSDTIATTIQVALRPDSAGNGGTPGDDGDNGDTGASGEDEDLSTCTIDAWSSRADEFAREEGDRIFVRTLLGYVPPATVEVAGEIVYPGSYAVRQRDERLSSVLERAGGPTDEAYRERFRLMRDGVPVPWSWTMPWPTRVRRRT